MHFITRNINILNRLTDERIYVLLTEKLESASWIRTYEDFNKFPDFFHKATFIDSTHMKI